MPLQTVFSTRSWITRPLTLTVALLNDQAPAVGWAVPTLRQVLGNTLARNTWSFCLWLYLLVLLAGVALPAGAATIYSRPHHQSPVSGDPDDLLMLPGTGFNTGDRVVYQAVTNTSKRLKRPARIPAASTPTLGMAPVVSYGNVPDSLTVKLPDNWMKGQAYALWVVDSRGQWSNGVLINDARPLWLTPAYVFESADLAGLSRRLKVIGRNLQPAPGKVTKVRLSAAIAGQSPLMLPAADDGDPATTLEQYVAEVQLPASLKPGDYSVQVSRDGVSWVPMGQRLTVSPDPSASKEFLVVDQGCASNDGKDDTQCIREAVKAAAKVGGTVLLDAGTWDLIDGKGNDFHAGIVVPPGVNLRGAGSGATTLLRRESWGQQDRPGPSPVFSLLGRNRVEGIKFKDESRYRSDQPSQNAILQLGKLWYSTSAGEPKLISDVVITHNLFDKPFRAIVSGGLSAQRIFITHNEFGAFETALLINSDNNNLSDKFHFDDAVVAFNTFKPGSYMNVAIGQGTIASQIGASRRLDFSRNLADGASTQYLDQPGTDARGWRAGFFWHMANNHEMILVSQNTATCTGDKTGDGEAFAFDNNRNTFGFTKALTVRLATANTVIVEGPLQGQQQGKTVPAQYYGEHWVQVAQGTGVGQVRRLSAYVETANGTSLTVDPPWDVIPGIGSRLLMGREFWQLYVVDNQVDHRAPPCQKSNRTAKPGKPSGGGGIALWAQAADSVIAGNRQFDTLGILLHPAYSAVDPRCPECKAWSFLQYFIDVRDNLVDHEYRWDSDCSWSGISLSQGESPTPGSPPPATAYGVNIARNRIVQADGFPGGAISVAPTWWDGPEPASWRAVINTLIHHNRLEDIGGSKPNKECATSQKNRTGIVLKTPTTASSVLYGNDCAKVSAASIEDRGSQTIKTKSNSVPSSCEAPK